MKKKSGESLKRTFKHTTRKTNSCSFEERLNNLARVGLVENNYLFASIQAKQKAIDEWKRNRLKYFIWSAAAGKKPQRKLKNLFRFGVGQDLAYAWKDSG